MGAEASKKDSLPLSGIKVVEFAGLAPVPFAGMVLADFGAEVIRIDRTGAGPSVDILARGKRSIAVSLKHPEGLRIVKDLIAGADILIEPFRPGVMEKLSVGPEECLSLNPRLIYARLTGYGRNGEYGAAAGHDINYLAMSGVLSMIRPEGGTPFFPMNLLADFAGGGMICVQGILLALIERARSGRGQVIVTDMVSGVRYLSSFPLLLSLPGSGSPYWTRPAGRNLLDGGAPFYAVYRTKDDKFITLGALEPQFYAEFVKLLDQALSGQANLPTSDRNDPQSWPELRKALQLAFSKKSREDWENVFKNSDACVAPVLEPAEAASRESRDGGTPLIAPRLSRTGPQAPLSSAYIQPGQDTVQILRQLGRSDQDIKGLEALGAVEAWRSSPKKPSKL